MTSLGALAHVVFVVLGTAAVALIAHEAAHAAVAAAFGHRVRLVRNRRGIGIGVGETGETIPALDAALIAAAGPLVSLALAASAYFAGSLLLAEMSAELGLFNAMPFPHSDARRFGAALSSVRSVAPRARTPVRVSVAGGPSRVRSRAAPAAHGERG
jgi:hypothetical protein